MDSEKYFFDPKGRYYTYEGKIFGPEVVQLDDPNIYTSLLEAQGRVEASIPAPVMVEETEVEETEVEVEVEETEVEEVEETETEIDYTEYTEDEKLEEELFGGDYTREDLMGMSKVELSSLVVSLGGIPSGTKENMANMVLELQNK